LKVAVKKNRVAKKGFRNLGLESLIKKRNFQEILMSVLAPGGGIRTSKKQLP